MKSIIKNSVKSVKKCMLFLSVCVIITGINVKNAFALTAVQYDRFVEDGRMGNLNIEVNAKGQMFRKFGHFIIDGVYTGGDPQNSFYNEENSRDLAVLAVTEDSVYDVYGEIDYDEIDYSYEDDEEIISNATKYDRATFNARVERMDYGNTLIKAIGYGKYNLRPGKNLTAFIKFAYDFYKNNSGEVRVGCKTDADLVNRGINSDRTCPMEELEIYANANYTNTETTDDVDLKRIWKECTEKWEYQGSGLNCTENIFEHLQDIFMCYVYLKPGIDKISETIGLDTSELSEADYGAILSMMYERFGGRPINPARVETGNAIPVIGTGDVLPALVDLKDTNLDYMSLADKIYTCMIEVKYKNNDLKLASWLKEAELVNGGYEILSAEDYDIYMKAYNESFQLYGQDTANDTLLDYGCVLTPDIFESKISFEKALVKFRNVILAHFGSSSFYNNRNNANYVAKSYAMAKKMCENSAFCDITDIYACDMDVVSHTYGYDSSNIILLADTQVVQLNDSYGEDCDTDQDGINDNVEAHTPEEVDITNFLIEYCKYNKYTEEEKAEMLAKNSKVVMYNYSSNPVLPDSDFDGRDDLRDGRKLDNEYNSKNETNNYSNIRIKFAQDYRYFFMDSTEYYEELAEMGLILSNMASKKKSGSVYVDKKWENNNTGEPYTANNLAEYMYYIGMENRVDHTNENVPYTIGQHDVIALLGKVNNLERNVITLVVGENENYKDILAANYDGSLDDGGGDDIHHQGYDYYAEQIYQALIDYDNSQTADRWKKSYWIVGYGTGGSIANLVAKKFIDYKHVNTNVYCYTYQAPNTINCSKIASDKRIWNRKYNSIFNIENLDDITLNLVGEKIGFDKYGARKSLNLCETTLLNTILQTIPSYKNDREKVEDEISDIEDIYDSLEINYANNNYINMYMNIYLLIKAKSISSLDIEFSNRIIDKVKNDNLSFDKLNERATYIYTKQKKLYREVADAKKVHEIIKNNPKLSFREEITSFMFSAAKKRLVNCIIKIGTWYTKTVATYQGYLQTKYIYEKELDKKYVVKRVYTDRAGTYERNVMTDNIEDGDILYLDLTDQAIYDALMFVRKEYLRNPSSYYPYWLDDWYRTSVLSANEEQLMNYVDYYDQIIKDNLYYYPNEYLDENNEYYHAAGDDCVRFAWTVFTAMDSEFPNKLYEYSEETKPLNINSSRLSGFGSSDDKKNRQKVEYAMYKLGFDIYDANYNQVEKCALDKNREYVINPIYSNFELEPGDFLVRGGHVAFYLGGTDSKGSDSFGWGEVRSEFPQHTSFKRMSDNRFGNNYWRIYRYTGRKR